MLLYIGVNAVDIMMLGLYKFINEMQGEMSIYIAQKYNYEIKKKILSYSYWLHHTNPVMLCFFFVKFMLHIASAGIRKW